MTVTIASCGEEVFLNAQQAQIVRQRLAMVLLLLHEQLSLSLLLCLELLLECHVQTF